MPFLSPNQQCQSTELRNITFHGRAYPKLTWRSMLYAFVEHEKTLTFSISNSGSLGGAFVTMICSSILCWFLWLSYFSDGQCYISPLDGLLPTPQEPYPDRYRPSALIFGPSDPILAVSPTGRSVSFVPRSQGVRAKHTHFGVFWALKSHLAATFFTNALRKKNSCIGKCPRHDVQKFTPANISGG